MRDRENSILTNTKDYKMFKSLYLNKGPLNTKLSAWTAVLPDIQFILIVYMPHLNNHYYTGVYAYSDQASE